MIILNTHGTDLFLEHCRIFNTTPRQIQRFHDRLEADGAPEISRAWYLLMRCRQRERGGNGHARVIQAVAVSK
jgi:hypothetical protein